MINLINSNLSEEEISKFEIFIFDTYIPLHYFYDIESMQAKQHIFKNITDADYYLFDTVFTDDFTFQFNITVEFNSDLTTIENEIKNETNNIINSLFEKYRTKNLKKGKVLNLIKEDLKFITVNILDHTLLISELVNLDNIELNYKNKLSHIKEYLDNNHITL